MKLKKLYSTLAAVASLVGIGMVLGYFLGNGTSNTPLWVAGILIVLGAVMLGMAISTKEAVPTTPPAVDNPTDGQVS